MYKSSNFAINNLTKIQDTVDKRATYQGIATKAIFFGFITVAAAFASILLIEKASDSLVTTILIASIIGSLVFGLVGAFAPSTIPVVGSLYCICTGIMMGAVSWVINDVYPGVVPLALLSTVGVFVMMTILYRTGTIKVTQKMYSVLINAVMSMLLIGLVVFIATLINPSLWELFYGGSILSIGISVVMVVLASFFILLDLHQIDTIVASGLDKKYEWRGAYGLILTLIWLYIEFLRLFAKIASRAKR